MSAPTDFKAILRAEAALPFCPGCGHASILEALDAALIRRQLDPRRVVIVSDIGCVGLSDQYFSTHTFCGLHGRAVTYATGIKLARPDLSVVVLIGDGGCGIGAAHLLAAARRNIGLTVLVFNNLNFGMTGGQASSTTPPSARTPTTPGGNPERPLDIGGTVGVNGAAYVWRGTTFDSDLSDRIAEAVSVDGFSLLDIWGLCTGHYVPNNAFSKKALSEAMVELGFRTGILFRAPRAEYSLALRRLADPERTPRSRRTVIPRWACTIENPMTVVLAGSAGGKVRSASRTACAAGVLSGLFAAQRDDYPVTVRSGHSVSELLLSPRPIDFAAISTPDLLVVVTEDGWRKARPLADRMTDRRRIFIARSLVSSEGTRGATLLDLAEESLGKGSASLVCLTAALASIGMVRGEALVEACRLDRDRAEEQELAVKAGLRIGERIKVER